MVLEALVLSVAGGYARVRVGGDVLLCQFRGRLRRSGILPGDRVVVSFGVPGQETVERVLPRGNVLKRPAIANVDQALVVFTASEPPLNLPLVDRITVLATHAGVGVILCLNKVDLMDPGEALRVGQVYQPSGFPFFATSALMGDGVEGLRPVLEGRVTVMAGQSGVGKSRLLNSLDPSLSLATGALSRKISRGKHITRQVELLQVQGGGIVADAPGFSRLDLEGMSPGELGDCYPEIRSLSAGCRFTGCRHQKEPGCDVKESIGSGISLERYSSYCDLLAEILEWEKRRYE
jgi:ribosome biogenesis GTPase